MRSIEKIQYNIIKTKSEIQKGKEISGDWRIGKDKYDSEMIEERNEFFKISQYVNEIITTDKIRIDELTKLKLEDTTELDLLQEHHKLLVELLMNFYR